MSAGGNIVSGDAALLCVDVGSTWTKAALVEVPSGRLLATASTPTTLASDVLEGLEDVRASAEAAAGRAADDVLACSSAGGGLRLAVVGYERVVTAEAGARVGVSAGARVVHVSAGPLDALGLSRLREARPDVVLLVGGTDGGNADVLLHNAKRLAERGPRVPYVVAGNTDVREEVCATLGAGRRTAIPTANVLPRIGILDPMPARLAIREVFVRHVIGGKKLSRGGRFARLVRAATPDAVLTAVELLADGAGEVAGARDVVVVDVGGATTDVYSVLTPDPEESALHREVVEVLWRERTVEGDLGVRWNAPGVVAAAVAERLLEPADTARLEVVAAARAADPGWVPVDDEGRDDDATLARLAMTVALRRHARGVEPGEGGVRRPAKDLRPVRLVVGSGGVLRHADAARRTAVLEPATHDLAGGWKVPSRAAVVVDGRYVLAAAGLLAPDHPEAAARLLAAQLTPTNSPPTNSPPTNSPPTNSPPT
ncbi:MAG TPA: glutamate mutase L [Actinomycetes bacterium]|nr:glutamate mutase L [Actinomycetes bacterium]